MRKLFLALIFSFLFISSAKASDLYFAQSSAGSANGTSCANAYAVSGINTSGYWVANNNLHLCGTITGSSGSTIITAPASGSSGSPITLMFEPGASMTAPYWAGSTDGEGPGAITISGSSYITIDGSNSNTPCGYVNGSEVACNGSILATANGTHLANQQNSTGIYIVNSSNIEIRNLKIAGMYINDSSTSDTAGQYTYNISFVGSPLNNILIHNCELANSKQGFSGGPSGTTSTGIAIYNCQIHDHAWGGGISNQSTGTTATWSAYNNEIYDWTNWGAGYYHTDGIVAWGTGNGSASNMYANIYNNYFHGNLGTFSPTGMVFCSYGLGSNGNYSAQCNTFNNLFVETDTSKNSVAIWYQYASNSTVYNNTFIAVQYGLQSYTDMTGIVFKNNICSGVQQAASFSTSAATALASWDYNDSYNLSNGYVASDNGGYYNLSSWQGKGYDTHGSTSSPNLSSSYLINSASGAAYQTGVNLTSLSITALDSDQVGTSRPSTGAWDMGAYEYTSGSGTLTSPSFSTGTGTYNNNQSITITCSSGTACYSTSGTATAATAGTCDQSTYSSPVAISITNTVLSALCTEVAYTNSSNVSATYTLTCATPTASPGSGSYSSSQNVTLSTATTSASVLYAVNSAPSCPSTGSTYSSPVSVMASETLEAITCKANYNSSTVLSAAYTITGGYISGTGGYVINGLTINGYIINGEN